MVTAPEHDTPLATTPAQDTVYEPVVQRKVVGAGAAFAVVGTPHVRVNEAVKTATTFIKRDTNCRLFSLVLVLRACAVVEEELLCHKPKSSIRLVTPTTSMLCCR